MNQELDNSLKIINNFFEKYDDYIIRFLDLYNSLYLKNYYINIYNDLHYKISDLEEREIVFKNFIQLQFNFMRQNEFNYDVLILNPLTTIEDIMNNLYKRSEIYNTIILNFIYDIELFDYNINDIVCNKLLSIENQLNYIFNYYL